MAVLTLDISQVRRVESDLDVCVDVEDGVVTNAWAPADLLRGFEIILRDKGPHRRAWWSRLAPAASSV